MPTPKSSPNLTPDQHLTTITNSSAALEHIAPYFTPFSACAASFSSTASECGLPSTATMLQIVAISSRRVSAAKLPGQSSKTGAHILHSGCHQTTLWSTTLMNWTSPQVHSMRSYPSSATRHRSFDQRFPCNGTRGRPKLHAPLPCFYHHRSQHQHLRCSHPNKPQLWSPPSPCQQSRRPHNGNSNRAPSVTQMFTQKSRTSWAHTSKSFERSCSTAF